MTICQRWSRNFFGVVCDFVSMKAKTHVFVSLGFFSHPSCKIQKFLHAPPSCHTLSHRILGLVIFIFLLWNPCLPPSLLSRYVLFKSWGWERGHWCTVLSKLNKGCETLAGKGSLYLILLSSAPQYGGKSLQGGDTVSWIFYSIALAS